MTKIEIAKQEADKKSRSRGHRLGPWKDIGNRLQSVCQICKQCIVQIPKISPASHWGTCYVYECEKQVFMKI